MRERTERGGERAFYHALAALVFAALCAWCAAALYRQLDAGAAPVPAPEPTAAPAGGGFRGVLLRREERLEAGAFPDMEAGARLSAAETGTESALFFPDGDGWEALSPDMLDALAPAELEALLAEADAPRDDGGPRLVYGFALTLAALYGGAEAPAPGPVTLRIEGLGEVRAQLTAVTADALGRQMLVLRLTEFPEELYGERVVQGEIVP